MNKEQQNKHAGGEPKKSKNAVWLVVFILIAAISIWAVAAQSRSFSAAEFFSYISTASPVWLCSAVLSTLMFILFEGMALMVTCRLLGHKIRFRHGYIYSASDIYFSSITPSATGGQPASAYFMIKDGMSGMTATAALLSNLCMYLVSLIVVSVVCFAVRPDIFLAYSTASKIIIICGAIVLVALTSFNVLLLVNDKLLYRICRGGINLLCKLRILRRKEKRLAKLDTAIEGYRESTAMISRHKKGLWMTFLFNFLQRIAQLAVSVFVYIATTGCSFLQATDVFFIQGYTVLGSSCIPVPGAIGVSDYLMLDGFSTIMSEAQAVNLELLSRSLSFYLCVFICGISVLIRYFTIKKRGKKL